MFPIHAVTVYCSSSNSIARIYLDAAAELGRAIAENEWKLVYGGNYLGAMASLADGARTAGGKVIGITPQLLVDKGIADNKCDELIVSSGMRDRKALMEERGDAFVALPGGLGTLEEIFEIIVGKQLRYHSKPIVLLDIAGYFNPLLGMLEHGIDQKFIKEKIRDLFFVAPSVAAAIGYLQAYSPQHPTEKWFQKPIPSGTE